LLAFVTVLSGLAGLAT